MFLPAFSLAVLIAHQPGPNQPTRPVSPILQALDLNHDGIRRDMAERLHTLVAAFAAQVSSEAVYEALTDQLIRKSTPLADDQFTSIHEASQYLTLHT